MRNKISELGVVVGYACNFKCAHCGVSGKKQLRLTRAEISLVVDSINSYAIRSLLFVGGEPSLYVEDINRILSGVRDLKNTGVRITTNGHFSKTKASAIQLLSKFSRLTKVQLSYDVFHKKFLPLSRVTNLYQACSALGIHFSVVLSIQSPLDLALIQDLRKAGPFPVGVQKVLPTGSARENGLSLLFQSFDADVLSRRCPNRDGLIYLCGEGFSVCCSSLVFNCPANNYIHSTVGRHLRSRFYKLITKHPFQEIIGRLGLPLSVCDFKPCHSNPCGICEHIFTAAAQKRGAGESIKSCRKRNSL